MNEKNTRRKFTKKFKIESVKLSEEQDGKVTESGN
jgi:transposase-like protein